VFLLELLPIPMPPALAAVIIIEPVRAAAANRLKILFDRFKVLSPVDLQGVSGLHARFPTSPDG
jgi:hypothetical protein